MTESMIYWITRLDGIHEFCHGFEVIALIFTVLSAMMAFIAAIVKSICEEDESNEEARAASKIFKMSFKCLIPAFCIAMMCSLARTFTPTTKEMIAINVIPQIANVENVEKIKDISKDMLDITSDWLKDMRKKYVNERGK